MGIFPRKPITDDRQELLEEAGSPESPVYRPRPMTGSVDSVPQEPQKQKQKPKRKPSEDSGLDLEEAVEILLSFDLPPFYLTGLIQLTVSLAIAFVGKSVNNASLLLYFAVIAGVLALAIGVLATSTRKLRRRNALFEVALPLGTVPVLALFGTLLVQWLVTK